MKGELWERFRACGFTDAETCRLRDLLNESVYEQGEPVARVDAETGAVTDVDWSNVPGWT